MLLRNFDRNMFDMAFNAQCFDKAQNVVIESLRFCLDVKQLLSFWKKSLKIDGLPVLVEVVLHKMI